jgi:light-regulated signal transduction histidine kinase (bacteriophytochrome)
LKALRDLSMTSNNDKTSSQRDSTQEQNAEIEKRVKERTTELEIENQELEAFNSNVAHDLRSPLRTILAFSQLLQSEFGNQLPARAQEYLETLSNSAKKMNLLIDDLLTFSRLSQQPLRRTEVDLTVLAKEALRRLAVERESRRVETHIENLPFCLGDASLLEQVFINLLSNALKFTRTKEIAKIVVGSETINGETAYFVRDNGIGFRMEDSQKLFTAFQRLHEASKYEGTGIGLALVERIIHRHGGRVWAQGGVDQGATFYFTIGPVTEKI